MSTPSIPAIFFIAPILLLLVGLVLTWLGWHGRPIDNHPICRKCGFDLFGLDQLTRCPECGAELSANTIRLGHRALRRWPLGIGIFLLVPSLLVLSAALVIVARKSNIETLKPVWWLIRDDDAVAIAELNRRLGANQLSAGQIKQIADAALRDQADLKRQWFPGWGDFIEAARNAKSLSDDQWQRYAKGAVTLTLEARGNVRRGDKLPVRIVYSPPRIGTRAEMGLNVRIFRATMDDNATHLGGLLEEVAGGGGVLNFLRNGFADTGDQDLLTLSPELLAALGDGAHTLHVDVSLEMRHQQPNSSASRPPDPIEWHTLLHTPVILLPENQPTVTYAPESAELTRKVRIAVSAGGPGVNYSRRSLNISSRGIQIQISSHSPVGLAFDVFLRDPAGREWFLQSVDFPAGKGHTWFINALPNDLDADQLDIVLRSNLSAAAETVDLTQIWQGELVYRGLPLLWPGEGLARPAKFENGVAPTTRPASTTQNGKPAIK